MREIYYNSDITQKATEEIKLLSLYYVRINIVNDIVYSPKFETVDGNFQFSGVEDLQFIPESFESEFRLLIDENLIKITEKKDDEKIEFETKFSKKISAIVNSNHDLIFPRHPNEENTRIITEEVYDIMHNMLGYTWQKPVETNFIWWYYAFKLKWFIKLLLNGENCITNSNNLSQLFSAFIKETNQSCSPIDLKGSSKSLSLDALRLSLPNPRDLSFEDILELKFRLKDELEWFSQTINSIEVRYKETFTDGGSLNEKEYESIFFNEIKKPLFELEGKMKNLQSKTFRKFLERLQNPKSYAPLVGTVVASMPIHYTLLASLGITTGISYLEYREEKREIVDNGMYFLLKLK